MKEILVRAQERRRILHLVSDAVSQQVRFDAVAVGDEPIAGVVEVAGSRWLFPKEPRRLPLQPCNVVRKGMFDTLFSIYVTPEQDTRITLRSRHFTARMLFWVLLGVLVVGIASAMLAFLSRG